MTASTKASQMQAWAASTAYLSTLAASKEGSLVHHIGQLCTREAACVLGHGRTGFHLGAHAGHWRVAQVDLQTHVLALAFII